MAIKENLAHIRTELPAHVTLVAVSKTKPLEMIHEAYDAGQRHFGENYIQELQQKQTELPADIRWHAIGHLQSNKVKYIAPFVHLIHGVDSLKLVQEISKQGIKHHRKIDCLLQLHIASEETKFGLDFEECENLLTLTEWRELKGVRVCGFMGMATNTPDENVIRTEFRSLHEFFMRMKKTFPDLTILSMGMSSDYKIAVEEGSTMVRIGSSIFGERIYTEKK